MTAHSSGIKVEPQSYASIEKSVRKVRAQLKMCPDEPIGGIKLFEKLDSLHVNNITLDYAVNELRTGVEAETRYDCDDNRILITLSPDTYNGLEAENPRDRFSLCHEIGHAFLHAHYLVKLAKFPESAAIFNRGQSNRHETFRDSEWQAEGFGAALLMPVEALARIYAQRRSLEPIIVQEQFGVSEAAAKARIKVFNSKSNQLLN